MRKFTKEDTTSALEIGKIAIIGFVAFKGIKLFGDLIGGLSNQGTGSGVGTAQNIDCSGLKNLSFNEGQYKITADAIDAAVWTSNWYEDDNVFAAALKTMLTNDDVIKLICVYGVRGQAPSNYYNLPQTVERYLDADLVQEVNADYSNKGISIQWVG